MKHRCCVCGHRYESPNVATEKKVRAAVKVNGDGPWCELCRNLEMAVRVAEVRKVNFVAAVQKFLNLRRATK